MTEIPRLSWAAGVSVFYPAFANVFCGGQLVDLAAPQLAARPPLSLRPGQAVPASCFGTSLPSRSILNN